MQAPNFKRVQALLEEAKDDELDMLLANPNLTDGVRKAMEGEKQRRSGTDTLMQPMQAGQKQNIKPAGSTQQPVKMRSGGFVRQPDGQTEPLPPGSLPEEVADDVPALLSEGETVIPADVVRWHGLKTFEKMRDEAKMGFSKMDAEGRVQTPGKGLVQRPPKEDMKMAQGGFVQPQQTISSAAPSTPAQPSLAASTPPPTGTPSPAPQNAPTAPPNPGNDPYSRNFNANNPTTPIQAQTDPYGRKGYGNVNPSGQVTRGPRVTTQPFVRAETATDPAIGIGPGRGGSGGGGGGGGGSPSTVDQIAGVATGILTTAAAVLGTNAIAAIFEGATIGEALSKEIWDPVAGAFRKVGNWLGINEAALPAGTLDYSIPPEGLTAATGPHMPTTTTPATTGTPGEGLSVSSTDGAGGSAGADNLARTGSNLVTNPLGAEVTPDLFGRGGWSFTDTGNVYANTAINAGLDIAGGYLGNALSGMLTERTGQSWGSMIGGAAVSVAAGAGAFANTALAALALPGVGAFVGAFLGGVIGGQFGAKPSVGLNVASSINNFSKDPNDPWNSSKFEDGEFRSTKVYVDANGSSGEAVDNMTKIVNGINGAAMNAFKDLKSKYGVSGNGTRFNLELSFIANPNREKSPSGSGVFSLQASSQRLGEYGEFDAGAQDTPGKLLNTMVARMMIESGALDKITDAGKKAEVEAAIQNGTVLNLLAGQDAINNRPTTSSVPRPALPATQAPATTTGSQQPAAPRPAAPTEPARIDVGNGFVQRPSQSQQEQTAQPQNRGFVQSSSYGDNLSQYEDIFTAP